MPMYLNDDGSLEQEHGVLPAGQRPFTSLKSIETVSGLLERAHAVVEKGAV